MREEGSEEEEVEGVEVVEVPWREEEGAEEWWRFITKEDGLGPVYFTRSSERRIE